MRLLMAAVLLAAAWTWNAAAADGYFGGGTAGPARDLTDESRSTSDDLPLTGGTVVLGDAFATRTLQSVSEFYIAYEVADATTLAVESGKALNVIAATDTFADLGTRQGASGGGTLTVALGGIINVQNSGATLRNAGNTINKGRIILDGGTLDNTGSFTNDGTTGQGVVSVTNGGLLAFDGGTFINTNNGLITLDQTARVAANGGTLDNMDGTIEAWTSHLDELFTALEDNAGRITVSGDLGAANLTRAFASGAITFNDTQNATGKLDVGGAGLTFKAGGTLGAVTANAIYLSGGGGTPAVFNGNVNANSIAVGNVTTENATFNAAVRSNLDLLNTSSVTLAGLATYAGNTINLTTGTTLRNTSSNVIDLSGTAVDNDGGTIENGNATASGRMILGDYTSAVGG